MAKESIVRVVFFGTPELAVPSLEAVAGAHDVVAVVCRPDKPRGRSGKLVPPPTKAWAVEHDIEVMQPQKLNDGTFETWLREKGPEVCVLVAYGRILKQPILDVPTHGFLNVHPSLLPRHRGPSPIQTAILEGDEETGVTIMRLDAGTDTGDMILSESIPIEADDTTQPLSAKLADLGARLVVKSLDLVERGEAVYVKQDDSLATHSKIFEKKDGRIHWNSRATDIHNLVRAATPWPVAQTQFRGDVYRVHRTRLVDAPADGIPGTVLSADATGIVVATGDGAIAIETIQAPGKRAMPVGDFLRGNAVQPGGRFEDF